MAITLLDMLLNEGRINRDQFEEALRNRVLYGGKIGTSLIELGYISEDDLARFLSKKLEVPYVHPDQLLNIPEEIISLLPRDLALKYGAIPIGLDKKRLSLVMSDPTALHDIDEISFITGYSIRPFITPEVRLVQALGIYYQTTVDFRYQKVIDRIEEQQPALIEPLDEPFELPLSDEEVLEEADVVAEEGWTKQISHYAPSELSFGLARAETREEIADLIIGNLAASFVRSAIFLIRDDMAIGWKGAFLHEPLTEIAEIRIPLTEPSVLKTIADGAGLYLGPLADIPMNRVMLDGMGGGRPKSVLLAPLLISGRIVSIVYADGIDSIDARVPELQKLLVKAALAFEALICREKILML